MCCERHIYVGHLGGIVAVGFRRMASKARKANAMVLKNTCFDKKSLRFVNPLTCKHLQQSEVGSNNAWRQIRCKTCGIALAFVDEKVDPKRFETMAFLFGTNLGPKWLTGEAVGQQMTGTTGSAGSARSEAVAVAISEISGISEISEELRQRITDATDNLIETFKARCREQSRTIEVQRRVIEAQRKFNHEQTNRRRLFDRKLVEESFDAMLRSSMRS